MKNKKLLEEDPAWKKRRRELDREMRKARFWKILAWTGGAVLALAFIALQLRTVWYHPKKKVAQEEPRRAIARVADKRIVTKEGKTDRIITFVVSRWTVDDKVDQKTYDSLKKDQKVLLIYDVQPFSGTVHIRSWKTHVKGLQN